MAISEEGYDLNCLAMDHEYGESYFDEDDIEIWHCERCGAEGWNE